MAVLVLLLLFVALCLAVVVVFVATCVRPVGVRQALLILDNATGNVRSVVVGPRRAIVRPLADNTQRLDLTAQKLSVTLSGLTTADCLPIDASLDVFYAFEPALLTPATVNEVLPFLVKIEPITESWLTYILRSLVAGSPISDLLAKPQTRARLEHLVENTLQANIQRLGVRVSRVRLVLHPSARMLEANLEAQIRSQLLATLGSVLGPEYRENVAQILPLEFLPDMLPHDLSKAAALSVLQQTQRGKNGASSPVIHWVMNQN